MQIEFGQQHGVYQIRPTAPANRTAPSSKTTSVQQAGPAHNIVRPSDTLELTSTDPIERIGRAINQQDISAQELANFRGRVGDLVAGETNQPISFDQPRAAVQNNNIYHRAYLKQTADYASLNAAAVDRQSAGSAIDLHA